MSGPKEADILESTTKKKRKVAEAAPASGVSFVRMLDGDDAVIDAMDVSVASDTLLRRDKFPTYDAATLLLCAAN